ncbi:MAG: hypothetical protein ACTSRG_26835 [Candidatus Helarchaeota archaeon]
MSKLNNAFNKTTCPEDIEGWFCMEKNRKGILTANAGGWQDTRRILEEKKIPGMIMRNNIKKNKSNKKDVEAIKNFHGKVVYNKSKEYLLIESVNNLNDIKDTLSKGYLYCVNNKLLSAGFVVLMQFKVLKLAIENNKFWVAVKSDY